VFLLCSDGLTGMISDGRVAEIIASAPSLTQATQQLVQAANEAGGRDNITVVLVRLEEVHAAAAAGDTVRGAPDRAQAGGRGVAAAREPAPEELQTAAHVVAGADAGALAAGPGEVELTPAGEEAELDAAGAEAARAAHAPSGTYPSADALEGPGRQAGRQAGGVQVRRPRRPTSARSPAGADPRARLPRRLRRGAALGAVVIVLGLIAGGAYAALQSVYFIGTNNRGLVTLYRGVPLKLPAGLALYSNDYVTGVSASTLSPARRHQLLDHSLRSEGDAAALIRSLELGQLE